jgi:hypothetical protein
MAAPLAIALFFCREGIPVRGTIPRHAVRLKHDPEKCEAVFRIMLRRTTKAR